MTITRPFLSVREMTHADIPHILGRVSFQLKVLTKESIGLSDEDADNRMEKSDS